MLRPNCCAKSPASSFLLFRWVAPKGKKYLPLGGENVTRETKEKLGGREGEVKVKVTVSKRKKIDHMWLFFEEKF